MDEALEWGRRAASACRAAGEIREFIPMPEYSRAEVRRRWLRSGEGKALYLVAIHHPDNYDPSTESEAMMRDIDTLNEKMEAAGARVFAGGLQFVVQTLKHDRRLRFSPAWPSRVSRHI